MAHLWCIDRPPRPLARRPDEQRRPGRVVRQLDVARLCAIQVLFQHLHIMSNSEALNSVRHQATAVKASASKRLAYVQPWGVSQDENCSACTFRSRSGCAAAGASINLLPCRRLHLSSRRKWTASSPGAAGAAGRGCAAAPAAPTGGTSPAPARSAPTLVPSPCRSAAPGAAAGPACYKHIEMVVNMSATPNPSPRRSAAPGAAAGPALKYWGDHPQAHDASDNVVPLDRLQRSRSARTARAGAAASRQPQPTDALTAIDSRMSMVNT